jgi:Tol biopolymer transport system component/DNA-binding winged helix-turn-helix (wHTH) protein
VRGDERPAARYDFGPFSLDAAEGVLLRDGEAVVLAPKVFATLLALVEHRGHVVSRDVLVNEIWPDTFVEEGNLTQNISTLRKVLGEDASGRPYIDTVPKRGYRFAAAVTSLNDVTAIATGTAASLDADRSIESGAAGAVPVPTKAVSSGRSTQVPPSISAGTHSESVVAQEQDEQGRAAGKRRAYVTVVLVATTAGVLFAAIRAGRLTDSIPKVSNVIQVTASQGVEDYPSWSPDGRLLAYESDQRGTWDIWLTQIGAGNAINRTADYEGNDRFPTWSPDGQQIAFWSERDGGGCYVAPALAGAARKVVATGTMNPARPQWSSNGTEVACIVNSTPGQQATIDVVSLATGASRSLPLASAGPEYWDLSRSPDGRAFAYWSGGGLDSDVTQLWVSRTSDGGAFKITDGRSNARGPQWSPDGRWLYYVMNRDGAMDLWRHRFARDRVSGDAQRVTLGMDISQFAFSADGSKVAFSKRRRNGNVFRTPIFADRVAGWGDATQITFDQAFIEYVDVSPDGTRLAVSSDRAGNPDIWALPVDGGDLQPLTSDPAPDWSPRWSPDGKRIVFSSYRSGNRKIWTMTDTGGSPRQVTSGPNADVEPTWSPDGRIIAFTTARDARVDIAAVRQEDSEADRLITFHSPAGLTLTTAEWSRDGHWLFASGRSNGAWHVWQISSDGSSAEPLTRSEGHSPRASPDGQTVFYIANPERKDSIGAVSMADHRERLVVKLTGRPGQLVSPPAADGRHLFFVWRDDIGNLFVMDIHGAQ